MKEWAYAEFFFVLAGAATSHAVAGDPVGNVLVPIVLVVIVMTSWALSLHGRSEEAASTLRRAA